MTPCNLISFYETTLNHIREVGQYEAKARLNPQCFEIENEPTKYLKLLRIFVFSGSKQIEFNYQRVYIGLHFHLNLQPTTSLRLLLKDELQSFLASGIDITELLPTGSGRFYTWTKPIEWEARRILECADYLIVKLTAQTLCWLGCLIGTCR